MWVVLKHMGVPTPIIDAMIVIGGVFLEKRYFQETKYNLFEYLYNL